MQLKCLQVTNTSSYLPHKSLHVQGYFVLWADDCVSMSFIYFTIINEGPYVHTAPSEKYSLDVLKKPSLFKFSPIKSQLSLLFMFLLTETSPPKEAAVPMLSFFH